MYAEAGLMFPLLQSYSPRQVLSPATYHDHNSFITDDYHQQLLTSFITDELPTTDLPPMFGKSHFYGCHLPLKNGPEPDKNWSPITVWCWNNASSCILDGKCKQASLLRTSSVSEYDLGGEGDLFKAPEPIIEEPVLALDPMSAAMTIISNGEEVISGSIKAADMDSIQNEHYMESIQNEHLNDVFYECKKDLLEKCVIDESFSELSDVKLPVFHTEEVPCPKKIRLGADGQMLKSVSSGCLNSMEWISGSTMRPNFLDFQGLDFETAFGLRRAYSEGDIQALGIANRNLGNTSSVHVSLPISELKTEERRQKLSRYRKKKTKRNFCRKIKYACRKALADTQPRVRGRFAKTDECEVSKPLK